MNWNFKKKIDLFLDVNFLRKRPNSIIYCGKLCSKCSSILESNNNPKCIPVEKDLNSNPFKDLM
jgi:hypothetical protein